MVKQRRGETETEKVSKDNYKQIVGKSSKCTHNSLVRRPMCILGTGFFSGPKISLLAIKFQTWDIFEI